MNPQTLAAFMAVKAQEAGRGTHRDANECVASAWRFRLRALGFRVFAARAVAKAKLWLPNESTCTSIPWGISCCHGFGVLSSVQDLANI